MDATVEENSTIDGMKIRSIVRATLEEKNKFLQILKENPKMDELVFIAVSKLDDKYYSDKRLKLLDKKT